MYTPLAAGHGGIRAIMDDMKLLSTEAEGVREAIPDESRHSLVNSSERVGALLGLQEQRDECSDSSADGAGTVLQADGKAFLMRIIKETSKSGYHVIKSSIKPVEGSLLGGKDDFPLIHHHA